MNTSLPTVHVFAYGSNMLTQRIRERCPSAVPIGIAKLDGYELRWHKKSTDGSGKCNVITSATEGVVVFGVVFRISSTELPRLDRAEQGYERRTVAVLCGGASLNAPTYFATEIENSLKPYTWYKAQVVAGAKQHQLPMAYIAGLEATETIEDPDRDRHARNMAIINDTPGLTK